MFGRALVYSSAVRLSARRLTLPQMMRWAPAAPLSRPLSTPSDEVKLKSDSEAPHSPSGTCFFANVPYNVTAVQLKEAFSDFGKVLGVKVLTSEKGLSRGLGFVQFESLGDAIKFVDASEQDPIYVLDRQLHVRHAQYPMKAVAAEPADTLMLVLPQADRDSVRAMFGDYTDSVMEVRFAKRQDSQAKVKAFVQFRSVGVAIEAMEAVKSRNQDVPITFARQRQEPATPYRSLTSRLSQHD